MNGGSVIRSGSSGHGAQTLHFLHHLLEMTLAMMVGMTGGAALFLAVAGMPLDEALRRHAVSFTLVMVLTMTVPMVAWMRHRGHAWRASSEMAAAMVVPAIPLICLRLADVISGPICGLYCASTILAMVLVMLYRRSEYSGISAVASPR
jgi:cytochrome bd-type quinol oxidase subunit 2